MARCRRNVCLGLAPMVAPRPGSRHENSRSCAGALWEGQCGSLCRGGGSLPGRYPLGPVYGMMWEKGMIGPASRAGLSGGIACTALLPGGSSAGIVHSRVFCFCRLWAGADPDPSMGSSAQSHLTVRLCASVKELGIEDGRIKGIGICRHPGRSLRIPSGEFRTPVS